MRIKNIILLFSILTINSFSQILFRSLPDYKPDANKLEFMESSTIRKKILLDGRWEVYLESDKKKNKVSVEIPSIYDGDEDLVFEKSFTLTQHGVDNSSYILHLLGVSYSADVSLNNSVIYRHQGGAFPFSVLLPPDILKSKEPNILSIKVHPAVGEKNRIPLSYQMLYPKEFGGIFRDIYISELPGISLSSFSVETISASESKARLQVSCNFLRRNLLHDVWDGQSDGFTLEAGLSSVEGDNNLTSIREDIEIKKGKDKTSSFYLEISSPRLWSFDNPVSYNFVFKITKNGEVIDQVSIPYSIISLKLEADGFYLNGNSVRLDGTAYTPVNKNFWTMNSYEGMRQDIKMIKDLGFNTVRFSKCMPHPYMLALCQEFGLLAFIELPLEQTPSSLLSDNVFHSESKGFATKWQASYNNFSALCAYGLGSSSNINEDGNSFFLSQTAELIKEQSSRMIYVNINPNITTSEINGIDFYGLQFMSAEIPAIAERLKVLSKTINPNKLLITELTYLVTEGSSNGYINPNTYEAQAKYFSEFYKFVNDKNLNGFIIGNMFDYRTAYSSLVGKYNSINIFPIGIVGEDRSTLRPAYKTLYALLHNLQPVTIPIGVKKDTSPIVFIIFGLILAIITLFLFNSNRKFREDAKRALTKPYNFFADVRDARMYSYVPSLILSGLVAASLSLIVSSFLFYFKSSLTFEKVVSAIPYDWFISLTSYMAWHPVVALIFFLFIFMIHLVAVTVVIRMSASTVINRVNFSSSFYVASWAHIPVITLIPISIVLYRILLIGVANTYIYLFWIAFSVWIAFRIFKGIHVILDVAPGKVYLIGVLAIVAVVSCFGYFLQINYLSIDYIFQALRELKPGA